MDLPLKKTIYKQHYRKEWEGEFKWLKPIPGDSSKCRCMYCKIEIKAKLYDIQRHKNTKKHKDKSASFTSSTQTKIVVSKEDTTAGIASSAETYLSLYIAEHSSINSVDHLTNLCKEIFSCDCVKGGAKKELKLHRTKCTNIITDVLCPYFKDLLIKDIGKGPYSLILDESTDISVTKQLGVIIKYLSEERSEIVSTFLGLQQLQSSNAKSIVDALISLISDLNLDIKNLMGIGTDNASVMVGINNGVFKILKEEYDLPHLVLNRCVCHSIQLAVSYASQETIPRNIEFLIRETNNWFCLSPSRQDAYKEIYEKINVGERPLKILKICATRWISIEPAIARILDQWDELKLHFQMSQTAENCYTATMLYSMFQDQRNKLYLIYLKSVLTEVQQTLKIFEGKGTDPVILIDTLKRLIESLCHRIINPNSILDYCTQRVNDYVDPKPYMGYVFEEALCKSLLENPEKQALKQRCIHFTLKLISELQQRLPENFKNLEIMTALSVKETLKNNKNYLNIVKLGEAFCLKPEDIDKVLTQYRNIGKHDWENKDNTITFWCEVFKYRDAAGNNPYQEIGNLAKMILSLPHSNADVERVFSSMNIIKTKTRNKMSLKTMTSILHIQWGLKRLKESCCSHKVPIEIINKTGSNSKYSFKLLRNIDCNQPSTSASADVILEDSDDDSDF
ncbi:unnamed protein product [Euphydryas editha]|uniref:Uncharacterized protein n=1 Tax=Euphydryas editha TaxID=104508 RepID=A0AAU9TDC7_EUPED|nr:unnamed protein product [Euphydryas editha]